MKNLAGGIALIAILALVLGAVYIVTTKEALAPTPSGPGHAATPVVPQAPSGYKDATYMIDGELVTLVNGLAQSPAAPGSASAVTTRYFGNEAEGDLDGDGVPDIAFILTQDRGGSGIFYYVAAALKTDSGYVGTDALFLGDRIAPQTTEYKPLPAGGEIIVNYADRAPGEPMTASPSVGVSRHFKLAGG